MIQQAGVDIERFADQVAAFPRLASRDVTTDLEHMLLVLSMAKPAAGTGSAAADINRGGVLYGGCDAIGGRVTLDARLAHPKVVTRFAPVLSAFGYDDRPRIATPMADLTADGDPTGEVLILAQEARLLREGTKDHRAHGAGHKHVAESRVWQASGSDGYVAVRSFLWWNGEAWEPVDWAMPDFVRSGRGLSPMMLDLFDFMFGVNAVRLKWWTARLSLGQASVDIPTDPTGARALFADREVMGKRREALRHWVSAHARTTRREDQCDVAFVRAHLRGKTTFRWHGMDVTLLPSIIDTTANAVGSDVESFRLAVSTLRDLT